MFQRPKRFWPNAHAQRTIESRPDTDELRKRRNTTQHATLHRVLPTSVGGRGRHRLFSRRHLTGYIDPLKFPETVISWDDYRLAPLFQWFRDNPITGVVGIVDPNPSGNPFISQGIILGGELLHVYHKTHLAPEALSLNSADDELCVFSQGGINFGLTICADIEYEGLFLRYSEAGTQVVLHSSTPGIDRDQTTRNWQSGYDWWNGDC